MASVQRGHLDATAGRDVVFCHACRKEWYQADYGLPCPHCGSEATEIVTPENDPRDLQAESSTSESSSRGGPRWLHASQDVDSDPEEANIEDHIERGPDGLIFRQTIHRNITPSSGTPGAGGTGQRPPDADDSDFILRRFTELTQGLTGMGNAPNQGQVFATSPNVRRTVFRGPGFSGSMSTFTIGSGGPGGPGFNEYASPQSPPARGRPAGLTIISIRAGANHRPRAFNNFMGDAGPGPAGLRPVGMNDGDVPFPHFLATNLQALLSSMLNPANAVHGDAVYTQEALDRIITSLMEANPMPNAAPPASQAAIDSLQRKTLDESMLGPEGKAECTICIDDMRKGDEVTVLPCKHWFHDECVVLWLKEHNTCPICRASIERNQDANAANNQGQQPQQPLESAPQREQSASVPPSAFSTTAASPFASGARQRRERYVRTPSDNAERLAAIRNTADGRPPIHLRRNSLSPPSPGMQPPASEYSSRTRVRSPSWSRRDPDNDRDQSFSHYHSARFGQEDVRRVNSVDGSQANSNNLQPLRPQPQQQYSGQQYSGQQYIGQQPQQQYSGQQYSGQQYIGQQYSARQPSAQHGRSQSASSGDNSAGNGGAGSNGPLSWLRDTFNRYNGGSSGGHGT